MCYNQTRHPYMPQSYQSMIQGCSLSTLWKESIIGAYIVQNYKTTIAAILFALLCNLIQRSN